MNPSYRCQWWSLGRPWSVCWDLGCTSVCPGSDSWPAGTASCLWEVWLSLPCGSQDLCSNPSSTSPHPLPPPAAGSGCRSQIGGTVLVQGPGPDRGRPGHTWTADRTRIQTDLVDSYSFQVFSSEWNVNTCEWLRVMNCTGWYRLDINLLALPTHLHQLSFLFNHFICKCHQTFLSHSCHKEEMSFKTINKFLFCFGSIPIKANQFLFQYSVNQRSFQNYVHHGFTFKNTPFGSRPLNPLLFLVVSVNCNQLQWHYAEQWNPDIPCISDAHQFLLGIPRSADAIGGHFQDYLFEQLWFFVRRFLYKTK